MKKLRIVVLSVLFLSIAIPLSAQMPGRDADPHQMPRPTTEADLNRMIKQGRLRLQNISEFPAEKIAAENKMLTVINISQSPQLKSLQLSEDFQKLHTLQISETGLTAIPASVFHLVELKYFVLRKNPVAFIPAQIGKLQNLEGLSLQYLPIQEVPAETGQLRQLTRLEISHTYRNVKPGSPANEFPGIKTLPKSIGRLTGLKNLILDHNGLEKLPKETGNLAELTVLSLSGNKLKTLPAEIGKLSKLEALELSNNPLTALPESIGNLSNLKLLNISYTSITKLPENLSRLKNLETLLVSGTKLSDEQLSALKKKMPHTRIFNGKDVE